MSEDIQTKQHRSRIETVQRTRNLLDDLDDKLASADESETLGGRGRETAWRSFERATNHMTDQHFDRHITDCLTEVVGVAIRYGWDDFSDRAYDISDGSLDPEVDDE